jgi:hypothetical protein
VGIPEEKKARGRPRRGRGGITLKWICNQWNGEHGLGRSGSGQVQVGDSYEYGSESSGPIKCGALLDWLRAC